LVFILCSFITATITKTNDSGQKKNEKFCKSDLGNFDQNSGNHIWSGHHVAQWGPVADNFRAPILDVSATYDRDDDEGQILNTCWSEGEITNAPE